MWISKKKYNKLVEDNTNLQDAWSKAVTSRESYKDNLNRLWDLYFEMHCEVVRLEGDNKFMSDLLTGDAE